MRLGIVLRRFLLPAPLVTLICALKYRCLISPKAEVEYHPNLVIGRGTKISAFTKIKCSDGPLTIGADTSIGTGCFLSAHPGGLHIGADCLISPNVSIIAANYRHDDLAVPIRRQGITSKGVSLGDNVWLGASVTVLDGASIGSGSIITPNSVVSGTIPENTIASGSPAKAIFRRR